VPEALYRWRLTPGSRSASDGIENADALIRMMAKALGNPSLSAAERTAVERALASHRLRMTLELAHRAVRTAAPDARRRSLAVAREPGFGASTRGKAAVTVVSPGIARRLIARRIRRDPGADALARRGFQRPG
jgi:hypothetical protein